MNNIDIAFGTQITDTNVCKVRINLVIFRIITTGRQNEYCLSEGCLAAAAAVG